MTVSKDPKKESSTNPPYNFHADNGVVSAATRRSDKAPGKQQPSTSQSQPIESLSLSLSTRTKYKTLKNAGIEGIPAKKKKDKHTSHCADNGHHIPSAILHLRRVSCLKRKICNGSKKDTWLIEEKKKDGSFYLLCSKHCFFFFICSEYNFYVEKL